MIDSIFKKYFDSVADDFSVRQVRVWQKISAHMAAEATSDYAEVHVGRRWRWAPLAVSLATILAVAVLGNAIGQSQPGDKLYAVKGKVERVLAEAELRVVTDDAARNEIRVRIIIRQAQQAVQLESEAAADGEVTPDEQARIAKIKAEVGRAALQLAASAPSPAVETTEAVVRIEPKAKVEVVKTAEAQVVGEAVTEFLRSAAVEPGTNTALVDRLKAVVQTAQDEYKAAGSEAADSEPVPAEQTGAQPQTTGDTSGSNSDSSNQSSPTSQIKGEVESDEIEIK